MSDKTLDKIQGTLIGGAIGDAFGYPIEFMTANEIKNSFGKHGLEKYLLTETKKGLRAVISDDTQMSLFTASGLLFREIRYALRGVIGNVSGYVYLSYMDWLDTQGIHFDHQEVSIWLKNLPGLNVNRAPGNTCISALSSGVMGTIENPINESKGCGGIMRVAPLPLIYRNVDIEHVAKEAANISSITHGHELGYIPSATLARIIHKCLNTDLELEKIIDESLSETFNQFRYCEHIEKFRDLILEAEMLSYANDVTDLECIQKLGAGWVAEETLAIAIYCSLRYWNDFKGGIIASINHGGDSDSTGAITGNILGAYLGLKNIPNDCLEDLEFKHTILGIGKDIYKLTSLENYYEDEELLKKYSNQ